MAIKKIVPKILVGIISLILAVPINAIVFRKLVKPNTAELTIENKSNFLIETVDVKLCDVGQQLKQLEPGKSSSLKFDNVGECHYSINVIFDGGKSLTSEVGYITSGSNVRDKVVIEENQIIETKPVIESDPNYFFKTAALFLSYAIIAFLLYKGSFFVLRKLSRKDVAT